MPLVCTNALGRPSSIDRRRNFGPDKNGWLVNHSQLRSRLRYSKLRLLRATFCYNERVFCLSVKSSPTVRVWVCMCVCMYTCVCVCVARPVTLDRTCVYMICFCHPFPRFLLPSVRLTLPSLCPSLFQAHNIDIWRVEREARLLLRVTHCAPILGAKMRGYYFSRVTNDTSNMGRRRGGGR